MIETEKLTLKGLMHGQFSKRFLTHKYLPLIYIQLSFFFLLAYAFYENYNFIRMDISFLGEPKKNPAGWYFWAIGMFFTGILVFPPIEYFYFRIRHLNKPIAIITRFLLILFGIGMIGLGAIPQYQNLTVYHGINTALAFGGLYLAILILLTYFTIKFQAVNKKMALDYRILLIMLFLELCPPTGILISQAIRLNDGIDIVNDRSCVGGSICPWYMTISFWEWMMFFGVILNLLILLSVLPEKLNASQADDLDEL